MTDLIDDTTPRLGSTTPLPKIISVDDHIVEPAHLWDTWLPARFRDRGPKAERRGIGEMEHIGGGTYRQTFDPDGPQADCWVYEDLVYINKRHVAAVGFDRDDMTMSPITYDEMRPGCYDPKARIADNEANWVEASLCFPTFPRFCGQTFLEAKDKELAEACVVAYNDFMVEEWCGDSGGRLLPLCIIPLWDAEKAAAEVRRNAARGVRAVCFSEIPPHLGLPSIHSGDWDPFFAACEETGTVVCMHIGSSSKMPATSADAPVAVAATLSFGNAMSSLCDFLFSGVLIRFPDLVLAYSEGQIGWLPYILERVDDVWREHRAWGGVKDIVPEPPSTYFHRQVYGCFFRDQHGLDSLDVIGADRVTFETDYPHTDSTWPDTRAVAEQMVQGPLRRGGVPDHAGQRHCDARPGRPVKLGDVVNPEAAHWGKPLDGVRVLALEQMQALPYATQLLGRLGAEVVKIESPGTGDLGRGRLARHDRPRWARRRRHLPAQQPVQALRSSSTSSSRPGATSCCGWRRASTSWPRTSAPAPSSASAWATTTWRPRTRPVVYLSISGFGHPVPAGTPDSPYAGWPALASIVEAMSGAYEFKRPEGQPPVGSPMGGLGDIVTALFAVIGTQAALRQRDRTGQGQRVDVAMLDAMVAVLDVVPELLVHGHADGDPVARASCTASGPPTAGSCCRCCGPTSGPTWPAPSAGPSGPTTRASPRRRAGSTTSSPTSVPRWSPGRAPCPSARPATPSTRPGSSPARWPSTPRWWPTRTWRAATCSSSTPGPTASPNRC